MKAKRSAGFVFVLISTIIAGVCIYLYRDALIRSDLAAKLLIAATAAGVCAVLTAFVPGNELANICAAAHVILMIAAISISISPMVNEMGLVYAGLNPMSNLTGYLRFAVVGCIAWLLGLISTFTGLVKKD